MLVGSSARRPCSAAALDATAEQWGSSSLFASREQMWLMPNPNDAPWAPLFLSPLNSEALFTRWRIASRKSSFVRFKHLVSSNAVLVSPSGPLLRSSALKLEKHLAFVREKEEDSS